MRMNTTATAMTNEKWGRAEQVSTWTFLSVLLIIVTTPMLVIYFVLACVAYEGSLIGPILDWWAGGNPWSYLPGISFTALVAYLAWMGLQVILALAPDVLHKILPGYLGGVQHGAVTPAGHQLPYQINGLQAWVISHTLFVIGGFGLGWFSPSIIVDQWIPILWLANITGYALALFAYFKAHTAPSHPEDCKTTRSWLYDFYMGVELNPRFGFFDFKLFFNGRPGIVAWTLINLSFAAKQYQLYGSVTNSMLLVNVLQGIYVLDFFWNEAWYLKTIDIQHEHFGWMLAWGDSVWLPFMYTLQGLYLVYQPVELSTSAALAVFAFGVAGYAIFRLANHQRYRFRATNGSEPIWGKPAVAIDCSYTAADGQQRQTKLLASGWWGIARHFNYMGDLMLSLSWSLACGFQHILPYFYIVYITILFVHRCIRDEQRCAKKYGHAWDEYCKRVPYRILPGVF